MYIEYQLPMLCGSTINFVVVVLVVGWWWWLGGSGVVVRHLLSGHSNFVLVELGCAKMKKKIKQLN